MNKKFVFIIFHSGIKYRTQGWLGIKYLISALKSISGLDIEVRIYAVDEVETAIKESVDSAPFMIGIPVFQNNLHEVKYFSDGVKKHLINTLIVIGNIEATIRPEILLENMTCIDIAIIGEGEHTLYELVTCAINGKSFSDCKGIYYRDNTKILKTLSRPLENNLDNFAFPDRDAIPTYSNQNISIYDILTSRGCDANCTFCASHCFRKQKGSRIRNRSLINIIDEIDYLANQFHASYIAIVDDTFAERFDQSDKFFIEFEQELKSRKINIQFQFNLRSENVNQDNAATFAKLKKLGLDVIFIGFEAGNDEDLKLYGKRAEVNDNLNAIRLLDQHEIRYRIGFIMLNPYSTLERIERNLAFLKQCNIIFSPHLLCSKLILLNGTSLLKKIKNKGLLIDNQDPLTRTYDYIYVNKEIEKIDFYFSKLTALSIDNIQLDIIDSYLRNYKIIEHPLTRSSKFVWAERKFYDYIDNIKQLLLEFCYFVVERTKVNTEIEDTVLNETYIKLSKNVDVMYEQLKEVFSLFSKD